MNLGKTFTVVFTVAVLQILGCMFPSQTFADELTRKEKQAIKRIHDLISKGGRLYKAKNFDASTEAINDARKRIIEVANNADADLIDSLKPEQVRLKLAHRLLTESGQSPTEIPSLPQPIIARNGMVSFKNQVAPLLAAKCGRCHVDQDRGDFSAASYNSLGQSTMVAVGLPDDSRIIEVIVDGDMPPGGSLLDEELQLLKDWISQGAKFDGDNADRNLRELAEADVVSPPSSTPMANQTVSFARDVAPILVENCASCHINDNPRANFSMQNFIRIMRGGDNGSPISVGKGSDSLIVQRLRAANGTNVMPPTGKLENNQIAIVEKWIDEGANFDGDNQRFPTRTVAAKSKADSQSHNELTADRIQLAEKNWRIAMPDTEPTATITDNLHLFSNASQSRLEQVGKLAEEIIPELEENLKSPKGGPFVKGNVAVFVFEKHYDFSEFAKMIENHSLPKEVTGFWGYSTIDAYVSLRLKLEDMPEDLNVSLARQLGAIKIANLAPDVPRWFADGMGHWLAERLYPRDSTIKQWDDQARQVIANMQEPSAFLNGKLPEHQAGLVAYLFVKQLREDTPRFKKLFRALSNGQPFEDSFLLVYGATPQSLFGESPKQQRRRRR